MIERQGIRRRNRGIRETFDRLEARTMLSITAAGGAFVPNQVLVQYAPGYDDVARSAIRIGVSAQVQDRIQTPLMQAGGKGVMEVLNVPASLGVDGAIQSLRNKPGVVYAEPNYIWTKQVASNDPFYTSGQLWGMYGESTSPANKYGSQAGAAWASGNTGSSSVVVAVIDEGIDYTHPDLAANIWTNTAEANGTAGVDDDGDGYIDDLHGWDFYNNDNTIYDGSTTNSVDAHGTHVAGTIGAVGGNGIGVAGMAWNVKIISAKFLGPNGGTTADAIKALDYLTTLKNKGVNIIASNNSWGGGGYSSALQDAIVRAAKADILFFVAAGNSRRNNDRTAYYPANYSTVAGAGYEAVTSVAAIGSSGSIAYFSNYGAKTVDIGAPGVNVISTTPNNKYSSYSGTSMATPHVTGAAALYAAGHPGASASSIRDAILNSATSTGSLRFRTVTGGRLNVSGFGPASSSSSSSQSASAASAASSSSADKAVAIGALDLSDSISTELPIGPGGKFRNRGARATV